MSALSSARTIGSRFAFGEGSGEGAGDASLGSVAASAAVPDLFPDQCRASST